MHQSFQPDSVLERAGSADTRGASERGDAQRTACPAQRSPGDVDALFREMDAVVCEERRVPGALGPEVLERAEAVLDRALRWNDPGHPVPPDLRRIAVERAARDLLAGRSDDAAHGAARENAVPPEPDARAHVLAALDAADYSEEFFLVAEAMRGRVSNAARVAEAVAGDAVLAGLLLRLVNSPFYGLGFGVDSLQRAVAFTGFDELAALSLALAVARRFGTSGEHGVVPTGWGRRAMLCGILAKLLARRSGLAGEEAFVAGLLHDAGGLIARRAAPRAFAALAAVGGGAEERPEDAERRFLGLSIPEIGARLLRRWELGESVARLVERRRAPGRFGLEPGPCVAHLAEVLAALMSAALPETPFVPRLDPRAADVLGLGPGETLALLERAASETAGVLGASSF